MTDESKFLLFGVAGGAAVLAVLYFATKPGAASDVGEAIGGGVVDVIGGVGTGVVDGISDAIGIPTTKETITDANACYLFLNEHGYWEASKHCSAGAFWEASMMKLSE